MRDLDTSRGDAALPVLGLGDNVDIAVAILAAALTATGVAVSPAVRNGLSLIAGPVDESDRGRALIDSGAIAGVTLWDPGVLDPAVTALLNDFHANFLLSGLVPARAAGTRQIVKFSYHWTITPEPLGRRLLRPLTSIGLSSRRLEIPLNGATDAASYHLEFATPPELRCRQLSLPGVDPNSSGVDRSGEPIAHAHAKYGAGGAEVLDGRPAAQLDLVVPVAGAWLSTLLVCLLTTSIFWLALLLPGAREALRETQGAATAVLLSGPAVFMGFLASRQESALSAWMLNPLRMIMFLDSIALLAMAASLVGGLTEPWQSVLWWTSAVTTGLLLMALVLGRIVGTSVRVRGA